MSFDTCENESTAVNSCTGTILANEVKFPFTWDSSGETRFPLTRLMVDNRDEEKGQYAIYTVTARTLGKGPAVLLRADVNEYDALKENIKVSGEKWESMLFNVKEGLPYWIIIKFYKILLLNMFIVIL